MLYVHSLPLFKCCSTTFVSQILEMCLGKIKDRRNFDLVAKYLQLCRHHSPTFWGAGPRVTMGVYRIQIELLTSVSSRFVPDHVIM